MNGEKIKVTEDKEVLKEADIKPKKFNTYKEALEHFLFLLNMESSYINTLYKSYKPFISQRNKVVELTNFWNINTENYSENFYNKLVEELELISNKKSNLNRSHRNFIIDLKYWLDHYVIKDENDDRKNK